jgi:hypothetical protein
MNRGEYLLSYGNAGDFGRFQSSEPLPYRRGDRLVVRSHRGQEIGLMMRPATEAHSRLLAERFVGQVIRPATAGDLELAERMHRRSQALFDDARRLITELLLPMEVLDAEIMLDGRQAILHHLRWAECDPRPLIDALCRQYRLLLTLHDLALPAAEVEPEEHGGCGDGHCGAGGCSSCSSGKCSTCLHHTKTSAREPVLSAEQTSAVVKNIPAKVALL